MKKFKRFIILTMTVASVALLIGCSNDSKEIDNANNYDSLPVDLGSVE